jgi:hypothetical protein
VSSAAFDTTAAMVSEEAMAEREHARLGHIGAEDNEVALDMEGGAKGNAKVYMTAISIDNQVASLGAHVSHGLPHFWCYQRSALCQIHTRGR